MTEMIRNAAGSPRSLLARQLVREPIDKPSFQKPQGRVFVIPERCKQCTYCWEFCPEDVLEVSQAMNSHGYRYPQVKQGKELSCVHCGMCEWICPEFAIYTTEVRRER